MSPACEHYIERSKCLYCQTQEDKMNNVRSQGQTYGFILAIFGIPVSILLLYLAYELLKALIALKTAAWFVLGATFYVGLLMFIGGRIAVRNYGKFPKEKRK